MKKKDKKPRRTLMERIAAQLAENPEVHISTGGFDDGSGCWIYVEPCHEKPLQGRQTFFSYSISFNHKQNKMLGTRIFTNRVNMEVSTNCVQHMST